MKRLSRVFSSTSAAVLTLSSLLTLGFTGVAHAATVTPTGTPLYWCVPGAGSFNTATNWNTNVDCSSGTQRVPQAGDNLVFDVTNLTANSTVTNDMTSLDVTDMTFTGTNTSYYMYTIAGNAITVDELVDGSSTYPTLTLDLNAGGALTVNGMNLGDANNVGTFALGANDVTIDGSWVSDALSGSGNVTVPAYAYLGGTNTSWTGALTVQGAAIVNVVPGSTGASNAITVANGGQLSLCGFKGASVASPLTVGGTGQYGAAISDAGSCGMGGGGTSFDSNASVNWTGAVTLTADTVVDGNGEFKVSGPLSGNYTLTQKSGSGGKVTVASSANTSKTPNGTQASSVLTTTYSANQPSTPVYVANNNIAVVDGTYGDTTVDSGGILKGSGKVGALDVNSGATLAPGHSPGCLSSGNFTLAGVYQAELGGTTACSGYDQMKVTGTVNVTGGALDVSFYNGFTPKAGDTFTVIDNDGTDAVTGTFNNLAEGATFTVGKVVLKISYVGGTGNDVVLTAQSVPTTPDTGFAVKSSNPLLPIGVAVLAAGSMLFIARRMRPAHVAVRNTRRK